MGLTRRNFLKKTTLASGAVIAVNQNLSAQLKSSTSEGPYFGNGCRNGWADQTSISLWSRLTKDPDANWNGKKFIEISKKDHDAFLKKIDDPREIHKRQIPDGYELYEMEGACPGSSGEVKIEYYPSNKPDDVKIIDWKPNEVSKDYTIQWRIKNLKPDTNYTVNLYARKNKSKNRNSDFLSANFKTPPPINIQKDVLFVIVSCHDYYRRDDQNSGHKIYKSMLKMNPDFYVHTGDIEYYDKPNPWAMTEPLMRFKWNRLFSLANQKKFFKKITTYFMKDDHDTLTNDSYPGMKYGNVTFERGLEIFDFEQFPSNENPYKTVVWGKDLQIWILDSRNYRSKNSEKDGPQKTIWGSKQKKWFFNTLNKSKTTFKVLISANPILGPDRANKSDNHANDNFKFEKKEIIKELRKQKNLFICNGDRHWQYVTNYDENNLWEFCCGAGTDNHQPNAWQIEKEGIRPEHKFLRTKGGFLSVNLSNNNSTIKSIAFNHHGVNGEIVNTQKFNQI